MVLFNEDAPLELLERLELRALPGSLKDIWREDTIFWQSPVVVKRTNRSGRLLTVRKFVFLPAVESTAAGNVRDKGLCTVAVVCPGLDESTFFIEQHTDAWTGKTGNL